VPDADIAKLKELGIAAVLTPGATSEQIVAEVAAALAAYA
jgi:methylmalonyl-CoA mutase cobalamin-binding subunit